MPGFVGLITDFGDSVYDGIVESVIKYVDPSINVIRIDNKVPHFSVLAGSYITYSSYRWLPPGSIIMIVVDPGVGTSRRAVVIRTNNYYFVAPDNGVAYEAAAEDGIREAYAINYSRVRSLAGVKAFNAWPLSYTFHGRDVFAPAAALIAKGVPPSQFATPIPVGSLASLRLRYSFRSGGVTRTRVVYIDKFGNVALGLTTREYRLPRGRLVVNVKGAQHVFTTGRTFADVRPGDAIAYINSFGFVELAINQGSAASKLNVNVGDEVSLTP
ncbi:SAM hydrolase/SAM-dependent halogenase family protein [Acidilobus sp.]|uniref:SAM hydrolase/SAM-dependent halogenase family protein n=1 Tax=Acidilobus sp. TaxID=1872109 RepID=UPI003D06A8F1